MRIFIKDERYEKEHEFFYEGGIGSFVEYLNRNRTPVHPKPIFVKGERSGVEIEIAMQYNDSYDEKLFSFANNINTHEGGTHLIGFKAALTRTMNSYATANNLLKNVKVSISGEDLREGLTAVISVKIPQPQFEGQTKTKLGNSEVKGYVETLLNEKLATYLEENPQVAKKVLEKSIDAARAREAWTDATREQYLRRWAKEDPWLQRVNQFPEEEAVFARSTTVVSDEELEATVFYRDFLAAVERALRRRGAFGAARGDGGGADGVAAEGEHGSWGPYSQTILKQS